MDPEVLERARAAAAPAPPTGAARRRSGRRTSSHVGWPSARSGVAVSPSSTRGLEVLEQPRVRRRLGVVELVDDDDVEAVRRDRSRSTRRSDWIEAKTCRQLSGRSPPTSSSPKCRRAGPAGTSPGSGAGSPRGGRRRAATRRVGPLRRALAQAPVVERRRRRSCRCRSPRPPGSGSRPCACRSASRSSRISPLVRVRPHVEIGRAASVAIALRRPAQRDRSGSTSVGVVGLERRIVPVVLERRVRNVSRRCGCSTFERRTFHSRPSISAVFERFDEPTYAVVKPVSRSEQPRLGVQPGRSVS